MLLIYYVFITYECITYIWYSKYRYLLFKIQRKSLIGSNTVFSSAWLCVLAWDGGYKQKFTVHSWNITFLFYWVHSCVTYKMFQCKIISNIKYIFLINVFRIIKFKSSQCNLGPLLRKCSVVKISHLCQGIFRQWITFSKQ